MNPLITENHLDALNAAVREYGFSVEAGGANHEIEGAMDTYRNVAELATILWQQQSEES